METNKIYNENCLNTMERMPDNFVDMILTSPPYDSLRTYNGYEFDFENIAHELFRILKEGGVVVWVVGDMVTEKGESLTSFKQAIYFVEQCGFRLHDTMIYRKNSPLPVSPSIKRYAQAFEYIFVLSKGKPATFNPIMEKCVTAGKFNRTKMRQKDGSLRVQEWVIPDEKVTDNIFAYDSNKATNDMVAYKHPAIFPDALARDMIWSWTNEDDLVYDPFMGSGTTAKACIKLNRRYIGSEISKEYCDIAEKRIKDYEDQYKLF